ncbi:PhaM family polyhydroxyalkanoate granule multifunctional regulatory protein [Ampullimonas aquatilis]|uniref:PhaM family polyhydroxyalkanoate granule multifunctional regulatory protein n=1 Tax=Ampullimonas aquatilis TaxID=1341549 RepID=UPI003C7128B5
MADGFEFLKKFWEQATQSTSGKTGTIPNNLFGGGFGQGLSNWAMPTLSVEELDKKISDLKSVEQWLTVNLNLLHSTIQALEVQRATLINIQNFAEKVGGNVSDFFNHANAASEAVSETVKHMSEAPLSSWADPLGKSTMQAEAATDEIVEPSPPEVTETNEDIEAGVPTEENASAASANAAPMKDWATNLADATVWWNQLQDQFQQVAKAALTASASAAVEAKSDPVSDIPASKKNHKSSSTKSASKAPKAAASKPVKPQAATTNTASPKLDTARKTTASAKKKATTKAATASTQHRTDLPTTPKPARPAFTVARALREKKSP